MAVCPKCGYERTKNDDNFVSKEECPNCGIFYKKWNPSSVSRSNEPLITNIEVSDLKKEKKPTLKKEGSPSNNPKYEAKISSIIIVLGVFSAGFSYFLDVFIKPNLGLKSLLALSIVTLLSGVLGLLAICLIPVAIVFGIRAIAHKIRKTSSVSRSSESIPVQKESITIYSVVIRFFLIDCLILVEYLIYAFLEYNGLYTLQGRNIGMDNNIYIVIGTIYACRAFVKKNNRLFTDRESISVIVGLIITHLIVMEAIIKGLFFDLIRFFSFIDFFDSFPPEIFDDRDFFRMIGSIIMAPVLISVSAAVAGNIRSKRRNINAVPKVNKNKKIIFICLTLLMITILFVTVFIMQFNQSSLKGSNYVGRFIAKSDGTVLDTKTNLMWATTDNGSDINWANAKRYCENYHGGGYTDWRMPTQDELVGLFDRNKSRSLECRGKQNIHLATELIVITCFNIWASETYKNNYTAYLNFHNGRRESCVQAIEFFRTLPVRSTKSNTNSASTNNNDQISSKSSELQTLKLELLDKRDPAEREGHPYPKSWFPYTMHGDQSLNVDRLSILKAKLLERFGPKLDEKCIILKKFSVMEATVKPSFVKTSSGEQIPNPGPVVPTLIAEVTLSIDNHYFSGSFMLPLQQGSRATETTLNVATTKVIDDLIKDIERGKYF